MSEIREAARGPVVVIGAGVVGASIAHHLARAGHDVIILDRGAPAGGVTAASFAWVGVAKSPAASYRGSLRQRASAEFGRVRTELTAPIGVCPFGAITWEGSDAATRAFVDAHQAAGHRMELLSGSDAMLREPALRAAPEFVAYALMIWESTPSPTRGRCCAARRSTAPTFGRTRQCPDCSPTAAGCKAS